jgi:hypothetical protein
MAAVNGARAEEIGQGKQLWLGQQLKKGTQWTLDSCRRSSGHWVSTVGSFSSCRWVRQLLKHGGDWAWTGEAAVGWIATEGGGG